MPFTIPADAPAWVHVAYWAAYVVVAIVFGLMIPRLRSLLPAAPSVPSAAAAQAGIALAVGYEATDVARDIKRIAEAAEDIADGVKSLAKSEEAGTARSLTLMAEQLARLDRKMDGR